MILQLINHLVSKETDLTPQKVAPELRRDKDAYKGANIFGEDCRNSSDWVDVDNPRQYEYLCYGSIDYENIHNRAYDRFN